MPPLAFGLAPRIEIDGTPLDRRFETLIETILVDDDVLQPSMFLLALRDQDRTVLNDARLKIGSRVVIKAISLGGTSPKPLIDGEVTALEAEYDTQGTRAIARGYDRSHRLHRGRHTETYNDATDSAIVKKVAGRAGVQLGQVDSTTVTHKHVSQLNQTDWEFLSERARLVGYDLNVVDGKLEFRKPSAASGAPGKGNYRSANPLQLVMGQDLIEFRPRITSAEQVSEVEVRGWDVRAKKAFVAAARTEATSAALSATPGSVAAAFGQSRFVSADRAYDSQSSVQAAATAIAQRIGSVFAEAVGVAYGNPDLRAGRPISVSVVADAFAGKYVPTRTRHVFDHEGYRTEFVVSGRQDRSLVGLVASGNGTGPGGTGSGRIAGMVVAVVTQNNDPDKLSRVKLKFPWLSDQYESDWARVVHAGAGQDRGALFLPEVGDEVLVAFEFGDVQRPYVVGGLYNGKDKPKLGDPVVQGGAVKRRGFVSRQGHRILLLDDDPAGIELSSSDGSVKIVLDAKKNEIQVYGKGKIVIKTDQALEIDAGQKVDIKSKGSVSIEATSGLTLKGATVKIEGQGPVDIDGKPIQLN